MMDKLWIGDRIYIADPEVAHEIDAQRREIVRLRHALRDIRVEANHLNATVREERIWHMASAALDERNQDGND